MNDMGDVTHPTLKGTPLIRGELLNEGKCQ